MRTTPVVVRRHVRHGMSEFTSLVDLLSGTGEGRGGSLDKHFIIVYLCLPLPILRLDASALTSCAPCVHRRSCRVESAAVGPLNRTEGSFVWTASYWAPKLARRDRSSSCSSKALLCAQPYALLARVAAFIRGFSCMSRDICERSIHLRHFAGILVFCCIFCCDMACALVGSGFDGAARGCAGGCVAVCRGDFER